MWGFAFVCAVRGNREHARIDVWLHRVDGGVADGALDCAAQRNNWRIEFKRSGRRSRRWMQMESSGRWPMNERGIGERIMLIENMMLEGRKTTEYWGWNFALWGIAYLVAWL